MASWNDLADGAQLVRCPVCMCFMAKKKKTTHTLECYKSKREAMDELGVIQCPLSPQHILPIMFLNDHLDGRCDEAMNLLRKFYQKGGLLENFRGAPPDYDPGIPERYLSQHNRDLLYLLSTDMWGDFVADFERRQKAEREAEREAANDQECTDEAPQEPAERDGASEDSTPQ